MKLKILVFLLIALSEVVHSKALTKKLTFLDQLDNKLGVKFSSRFYIETCIKLKTEKECSNAFMVVEKWGQITKCIWLANSFCHVQTEKNLATKIYSSETAEYRNYITYKKITLLSEKQVTVNIEGNDGPGVLAEFFDFKNKVLKSEPYLKGRSPHYMTIINSFEISSKNFVVPFINSFAFRLTAWFKVESDKKLR